MILLKILGYVWATPVSLIGLFLACFSSPQDVRFQGGAIEFIGCKMPLGFGIQPIARTFGYVIAYAPGYEKQRRTVAHERVHVLQCLIGGPFMILAYPLCSYWAWVMGGHYYLDNALEVHARREADRVLRA